MARLFDDFSICEIDWFASVVIVENGLKILTAEIDFVVDARICQGATIAELVQSAKADVEFHHDILAVEPVFEWEIVGVIHSHLLSRFC